MNASSIFTQILKYTGLLALVIAVVGGGLGYLFAGTDGLWSALVGVGLAILFAAIGSSLIFLNVSAYWLRAVQGILILVTVLADMARRGRAG